MVRPHADDLGIDPSVDRAIFRAFELGALGGASVLVTGPSFAQAAQEAHALGLPVWLHLALVDADPVSPACEIPSLVGVNGRFPRSFVSVAASGLAGRLNAQDLRLEIRRQIEIFRAAGLADLGGIRIDGHQHLHVLPSVLAALLDLSAEHPIRAVRCPVLSPVERGERSVRAALFHGLDWLSRRAVQRLRARGIDATPCWGALYAGHLSLERARAVLESLPVNVAGQLLCHPGESNAVLGASFPWSYDWEGDLQTIMTLQGQSLSYQEQ